MYTQDNFTCGYDGDGSCCFENDGYCQGPALGCVAGTDLLDCHHAAAADVLEELMERLVKIIAGRGLRIGLNNDQCEAYMESTAHDMEENSFGESLDTVERYIEVAREAKVMDVVLDNVATGMSIQQAADTHLRFSTVGRNAASLSGKQGYSLFADMLTAVLLLPPLAETVEEEVEQEDSSSAQQRRRLRASSGGSTSAERGSSGGDGDDSGGGGGGDDADGDDEVVVIETRGQYFDAFGLSDSEKHGLYAVLHADFAATLVPDWFIGHDKMGIPSDPVEVSIDDSAKASRLQCRCRSTAHPCACLIRFTQFRSFSFFVSCRSREMLEARGDVLGSIASHPEVVHLTRVIRTVMMREGIRKASQRLAKSATPRTNSGLDSYLFSSEIDSHPIDSYHREICTRPPALFFC